MEQWNLSKFVSRFKRVLGPEVVNGVGARFGCVIASGSSPRTAWR